MKEYYRLEIVSMSVLAESICCKGSEGSLSVRCQCDNWNIIENLRGHNEASKVAIVTNHRNAYKPVHSSK